MYFEAHPLVIISSIPRKVRYFRWLREAIFRPISLRPSIESVPSTFEHQPYLPARFLHDSDFPRQGRPARSEQAHIAPGFSVFRLQDGCRHPAGHRGCLHGSVGGDLHIDRQDQKRISQADRERSGTVISGSTQPWRYRNHRL